MKKICYITTLGTTIDSFFIPQINYLADNGFDVTVVCSPDIPDLRNKFKDVVHYKTLVIPRGISLLGMLKAIKGLKKIFREERFDLIQYSTPNAALCAAYAGKQCGITLRNYHLMGFRYLGANGLLRKALKEIEKWTCSLSTTIECVSRSNLELGITEKIFPKEKVTVVWNGSSGGIDLAVFDYAKRAEYREVIRKKYSLSEDEFVFGFVGRITRDKGINELLEAFDNLNNCKLLLVGNIENEEGLDQQLIADSKANPSIVYTGYIQPNEIEMYYCALDCLILPSYREGFGNAIIEAAAMGTPAIVSNIPGPIDAIENGVTAYTVEPRNTTDLQEKMRIILKSDYKKMGKAAHTFAKTHFDSVVLCEKILERKKTLIEQKI